MIKKTCLKETWIRKKSREISADPILVERAIFAFELLSLLIKKGKLPLIFKGGTSLMLLLPELMRLSIDVDIVTEEDATFKNSFNSLLIDSFFKRWEEDTRSVNKEVPKSHFKFYYDSPVAGSELYILVDILQSKSIYSSVIKKPILHPIFEVEEKIEVTIPSINSIAGDKLTAEERDLIINETFTDPVLLEPLEKGQVKDDLITVYYAPQDFEELLGFIAAEANHTEDKDLEEVLDSLHDKLTDILDAYEESE
jgi:predicted nucleotidyltransferase component of viral defense system